MHHAGSMFLAEQNGNKFIRAVTKDNSKYNLVFQTL